MTEADFFKVFYWLKPIVDFEKTGPLGQWYLKRKHPHPTDGPSDINCLR